MKSFLVFYLSIRLHLCSLTVAALLSSACAFSPLIASCGCKELCELAHGVGACYSCNKCDDDYWCKEGNGCATKDKSKCYICVYEPTIGDYVCYKEYGKASCVASTSTVTVTQEELTDNNQVISARGKTYRPDLAFGNITFRNIVLFTPASSEKDVVAYQVFVARGKEKEKGLIAEVPKTDQKRYIFRQMVETPYITYKYTVNSINASGNVVGSAKGKIKKLKRRF